MLTKEDARRVVNEYQPIFLEKAKKTGYICPRCGNGGGRDGTGITRDPKTGRWHCFKCELHEDIIGLWGVYKDLTDQKEIFKTVYDYFNLKVDEYQNQPKIERKPAASDKYLAKVTSSTSQTDYFKRRGLSNGTVERHKLGYDPVFRVTGGTWKAIIIPTEGGSYVARNTDPNASGNERYRNHGPAKLYLAENLQLAKAPIFIVEGELDALSIEEIGGTAVALGSTSNTKLLIDAVKAKEPAQPLILALDNDQSGEMATAILETELDQLGIPFIKFNPYGSNNDANAALINGRETFKQGVESATECMEQLMAEILERQKAEYFQNSAADHLGDFINAIHADTPCISTKFYRLDSVLDGGMYEGLYILGAVSALGKSTFALQLADQIAQQGKSVLFFSLEMGRHELMAKSISRLTVLDIMNNGGDQRHAKTDRGITSRRRYDKYSQTELDIISRSLTEYGLYAKNIFIFEGMGDVGPAHIRAQIDRHYKFTGEYPVVIVDYIQIMAPADPRSTDKQNIDKNILELKRISRDYKIPVLGISSFNRAAYKTGAQMESFKESGSLEYGSDVLMGLQLQGMGEGMDRGQIEDAKGETIRKVELTILKNRHGDAGPKVKVEFDYYRLFNYFKETGPQNVSLISY